MKKVILLGASGSIGTNTLEVIRNNPGRLKLIAVSCHRNKDVLASIKKEFPSVKTAFSSVEKGSEFDYYGQLGIKEMIHDSQADILLNAVAGSPGLLFSWEALEAGLDLALANKESIVMAGKLMTKKADKQGLKILPVDSEHSAIFHLLRNPSSTKELILTASGGAFRDKDKAFLEHAKPEDALKHPTWDMGKKITIDSATLANKGLEVIEAHYLFGFAPEQINVVIHKESLVHSFTRTVDNALYAHISKPDMKLPIQNALLYPHEAAVDSVYIDPWDLSLTFRRPDYNLFPMLSLAFQALRQGQSSCIAYNAANEVAVDAFLNNKISFLNIADLCRNVLSKWIVSNVSSIEDVLAINKKAFRIAQEELERICVSN